MLFKLNYNRRYSFFYYIKSHKFYKQINLAKLMKKELSIVLVLIVIILASFVSASFFSDIWNKITGKVIENICQCSSCYECSNMLRSSSCTGIRLTGNISEASIDCISYSGTTLLWNKTIDCQNHKIQRVGSTSGSGITIRNGKLITIKNCIIEGFGAGIYFFSNVTGSIIENNTLIGNSQQGINIRSSISNNIKNNTIYKNSNGIEVSYSNTTQILNNKISGSLNIGLSVSSGRNEIRYNEICGSKYNDLITPSNTTNRITNNTCMTSSPKGLCSNPCGDISEFCSCSLLDYTCGNHTICGINFNCGPCPSGQLCKLIEVSTTKMIYSCIACNSTWICGNWGTCINSTQGRDCYNECGTTTGKPIETQACVVEQTSNLTGNQTTNITTNQTTNCTQNWNCTSWSSCVNKNQTRTCTDSNSCGNLTGKPNEIQNCTSNQTINQTSQQNLTGNATQPTQEEVECVADKDCDSGFRCVENVCEEKTSWGLIIWIILIIIILGLAGLVTYIIIKKNRENSAAKQNP